MNHDRELGPSRDKRLVRQHTLGVDQFNTVEWMSCELGEYMTDGFRSGIGGVLNHVGGSVHVDACDGVGAHVIVVGLCVYASER